MDPKGFTGGVPILPETRPIWTNAVDKVTPYIAKTHGRAIGPGDRSYTGYRETIWRWRDDFQNDFAARMDWTTRKPADANHPPVVRLAHSDQFTVKSGEPVVLSALGTTDPDGDSLSYWWFQYPEAGTLDSPVALSTAENLYEAGFTAPAVPRPEQVHFILRVTDKGAPALSRYRRVIVTIQPR
jgi:hypothetical protein